MKIEDLEETYNLCIKTGRIYEKSADLELIRSLKNVATKGIAFTIGIVKDIPKDSTDWTFIFRDYYESLRCLIEAYLLFDGIQAGNHQCKNAYLCFNHPELNADWEFLETIRIKRNDINYRGYLMSYSQWNMLSLKFDLHINLLKKEIEEKLDKF